MLKPREDPHPGYKWIRSEEIVLEFSVLSGIQKAFSHGHKLSHDGLDSRKVHKFI